MTRNQQLAFLAAMVFLFAGLSIAVLVTTHSQQHEADLQQQFDDSNAAANRVLDTVSIKIENGVAVTTEPSPSR